MIGVVQRVVLGFRRRAALDAWAAVVAGLDAHEREQLAGVRFVVADWPGREDYARGFHGGFGYFFGVQAGADGGTALPDDPCGEVRIFVGTIEPFARATLDLVIRHELAHAFGASEADCDLAGLGPAAFAEVAARC